MDPKSSSPPEDWCWIGDNARIRPFPTLLDPDIEPDVIYGTVFRQTPTGIILLPRQDTPGLAPDPHMVFIPYYQCASVIIIPQWPNPTPNAHDFPTIPGASDYLF